MGFFGNFWDFRDFFLEKCTDFQEGATYPANNKIEKEHTEAICEVGSLLINGAKFGQI